jgi:hypothetical protein
VTTPERADDVLTPAQRIFVRIVAEAIVEDILEECPTASTCQQDLADGRAAGAEAEEAAYR